LPEDAAAAVDRHDRAGDEARFGRQEEGDDGGDVLAAPDAAQGIGVVSGQGPPHLAEDRGFEPLRAVNPTRFPSERHRPLGESSVEDHTRAEDAR
jgi:hypothetical protein